MRAFLRRCFLVEDLAEDKDAHVIADVRRYAARISVFPDAGTNRDHAHSPAWEEPGTKARRRPRA
jgi:hypothetical protein